jgi:hypothetical protein
VLSPTATGTDGDGTTQGNEKKQDSWLGSACDGRPDGSTVNELASRGLQVAPAGLRSRLSFLECD